MKFFFERDMDYLTRKSAEYPPITEINAPDLLEKIAYLLDQSLTPVLEQKEDEFTGKSKPMISIFHYLQRFFKYLCKSSSIYVLFLIYLNKYLELDKEHSLNELNIHRLIASALLLAYKQFMDEYYDNSVVAKVAGLSTTAMNQLELKFLGKINFEAYVSFEVFCECYQVIMSYTVPAAFKESLKVSPDT
ncbi:cyclin family putative virulence effector [Legionella worsleiensis]|uniref:Cyclin n=1 Tax=Legionella worsleiensis TaxID=45076 RepID=A0A0W1AKW8_9GAMM|nr:cyclin family putative virulence effector [Legionella worsleiensis]KTD81918.1 Cyclin [Legionella worsleiensis]STY31244.1 Cyclin [Legionella worsleiensis]